MRAGGIDGASATTAVVAPFAPKDADLFAIVSGFDAAYAAYADYQAKMERFWCLRWLEQEARTLVEARATGRDDHAMLLDIPLLVRVPGLVVAPNANLEQGIVSRGQRIEIEILATDLVDLTVQCRLVSIIEEVSDDELVDLDDAADDEDAVAPVAVDPEAAATPAVLPAPSL